MKLSKRKLNALAKGSLWSKFPLIWREIIINLKPILAQVPVKIGVELISLHQVNYIKAKNEGFEEGKEVFKQTNKQTNTQGK
jgi:hypothetical protein